MCVWGGGREAEPQKREDPSEAITTDAAAGCQKLLRWWGEASRASGQWGGKDRHGGEGVALPPLQATWGPPGLQPLPLRVIKGWREG